MILPFRGRGRGQATAKVIEQVQILRYAQEDSLGLVAWVTSGKSIFRPKIQGMLAEIWLAGRTGANSGHKAWGLCDCERANGCSAFIQKCCTSCPQAKSFPGNSASRIREKII
jgi:hypothetical protein